MRQYHNSILSLYLAGNWTNALYSYPMCCPTQHHNKHIVNIINNNAQRGKMTDIVPWTMNLQISLKHHLQVWLDHKCWHKNFHNIFLIIMLSNDKLKMAFLSILLHKTEETCNFWFLHFPSILSSLSDNFIHANSRKV